MEIKKYQDQKEEQVKMAEDGLEIIKEIKQIEEKSPILGYENITEFSNKEKEFSMILQDPEESAIQKSFMVASMVSQIKEVGLSPTDPAVCRFIEQELGITGKEFQQFLSDCQKSEEVEKKVLKLMEVPDDLIDHVKKESRFQKKKS